MEGLREIVSTQHFIQHGHCYLWKPGMLALQMGANAVIALACFALVVTAYVVHRRRPQRQPLTIFHLAAALFIAGSGVTHLLDVVVVWSPIYWVDGGLRVVTALAGACAAFGLPRLLAPATAADRPGA